MEDADIDPRLLLAALFPRRPDDYDPECEQVDTALKAIWLLYRRAKWSLLAEAGLAREEIERPFREFDLKHIASDHGRLRTEKQVVAFLRANPTVLGAALWMVGRYQQIKARARGTAYARRALQQAYTLSVQPDPEED